VRCGGAAIALLPPSLVVHAQTPQPNVIVVMGDDVGWANIGVYNQGVMFGRTPNLDRLANEGMRFTDYYAEASCTAGRANFGRAALCTAGCRPRETTPWARAAGAPICFTYSIAIAPLNPSSSR
jgi:Sulfatase